MTKEATEKQCPRCAAVNLVAELPQREYKCGDCGLTLAHLDTNAQGAIRGVLGWLLDVDAEVNERYKVTTILGKGGFGVTYLIEDMRLHGKHRAMKEIPESLFDEHESKVLGHLSHPSIPDIIDHFTLDGMVYLVLEFGGNRTLRMEQERRDGRIPIFVLLPWVRQLCDALQYLHSQNPPIIHRDLKPDNVLLDDNDQVMLIDFGIAKEATKDSVTRTLGRAVSHGFSPPEQAMGTGTDPRSDVYALGAIMYNVLTNEMPAGAHERITGTELEPLSKFLPNIPPLIETAIMKSLELNINLRQQSIAELSQVLDLVQSGSDSAATVSVANIETSGVATVADGVDLPSVQIPSALSSVNGDAAASIRLKQPEAAPPAQPRKQSQGVIYAVVGAVVVLLGGGYWFMGGEEETDPQTMQPVETQTPGTEIAGATAPAGTSPAINTGAGGLPSIFSNEQAAAPPTDNANSDEPLLDVFERHRDDELAKAPASTTPPDKPKRVNTTGNSGGKPGYDVTDPRAWNPVVH
jgi:serine/threonine-protein kinase